MYLSNPQHMTNLSLFAPLHSTGFHHPQMGKLGPHPRHSWATDGTRVDGATDQNLEPSGFDQL